MPLDDRLLESYIKTFYGYGTYTGDWWLVGMEEGGGNTEADIRTRLSLWDSRGRRELEDVDMFRASPEHAKWFTPRPPLQPTWRKLIRLILSAEGHPTDAEAIRVYQGAHLGRLNSNNCILELLPLPSPSLSHWIYGDHSSLPHLRDRRTYTETVGPTRVAHLRQRIAEHTPMEKGIEDRPGLLDAVTALKRGDVLLVAKRDRLGRDVVAVALVERLISRKGAKVVSAAGEGTDNDDPTSLLMRRMIDAFGEYERLLIGARTKAALRAKRAQGMRAGNVPYGFTADAQGRLLPNEGEQHTIATIRDCRAAGMSLRDTAVELNRRHLLTRSGTPWRHEYVVKVLRTAGGA